LNACAQAQMWGKNKKENQFALPLKGKNKEGRIKPIFKGGGARKKKKKDNKRKEKPPPPPPPLVWDQMTDEAFSVMVGKGEKKLGRKDADFFPFWGKKSGLEIAERQGKKKIKKKNNAFPHKGRIQRIQWPKGKRRCDALVFSGERRSHWGVEKKNAVTSFQQKKDCGTVFRWRPKGEAKKKDVWFTKSPFLGGKTRGPPKRSGENWGRGRVKNRGGGGGVRGAIIRKDVAPKKERGVECDLAIQKKRRWRRAYHPRES